MNSSFRSRFFALVFVAYVLAISGHFVLLEMYQESLGEMDSIFHPSFFIVWILLILTLFFIYLYKYTQKKYFLTQNIQESDELLNLIDDFVCISKTDIQGAITYASSALCKISGYSQEELIGKNHSIFRHPSNDIRVYEHMWQTILKGEVWSGELVNKTKNGEDFWIFGRVIPNLSEYGEVVGFTAVKTDITNAKKIEFLNSKLGLQVDYFNAVIKNANSGIGTMDLAGNFTTVNSVFSNLFGYSEYELIGKNCVELTTQDQQSSASLYLSFAKSHGKIYKVNKSCVRKDGGIINIEMSLDLLPTKKEFVVVINSLEDKIKLQKALNRAELLYKNAAIGFLIIDQKGFINDVNAKTCEIFGYVAHEMRKMHSLALHLNANAYEEFVRAIAKQDKNPFVQLETRLLTKENKIIWCEISGHPYNAKMALQDGSVIWTVMDISDKVQFRDQIIEQSKDLEEQVRQEVEKNIQNQKIYLEDKVSNAKFAAIGKLAAGITHEINTPLTYIKGNLEMIGFDVADIGDVNIKMQIQEDMTKVFTGIRRIENIVESMREMSQKSSEGRERINVYATIVTALTMAYNRSKHISKMYINNQIFEIGLKKDREEFFVEAQQQRIEQVWINIINNALDELVKVDEFDTRWLKITIHQDQDEVIVRFCDNAGGVNEEILESIFEPFVSTKVHGGMGVGLNICKRIVEDNSGQISVHNENGGAVFEIRFKGVD